MQNYETKLTPAEEVSFGKWKAQYAPSDSGFDYDLRGAYKAGLKPDAQTGHWPDRFKKPNHPTFSVESQYATGENLAKAGTWKGDTFVPSDQNKYIVAEAEASNPYLKSILDERRQVASQQTAMDNLRYAAQRSPDDHAKALEAQTATGQPIPVSEAMMSETSYNLRMRKIAEQLQQSPEGMKNFFGQDPDALTIAQDDLGVLKKVTDFLGELKYTPSVAASGLISSVLSTEDAILSRLPTKVRMMLEVAGMQTGLPRPSAITKGAADYYKTAETLRGEQENLNPTERGVLSGVESVLQNAPLVLGTAGLGEIGVIGKTAQTLIGSVGGGLLSGGQARSEALDQGASEPRATALGGVNASIEAATELLPLHYFSKYAKGELSLGKLLTNELVSENVGEQVATLGQDFAQETVLHPEKTLKQYLQEHDFQGAAYQTLVATMTSIAVQGGALKAAEGKNRNNDRAKQDAQILTTLDDLMGQSKTRGRSPEVIKRFIETQIQGEVRFSAQDLMDALEKHGISLDEVRQKVPAINEQIDDAFALGSDVVVPVSQWMAGIAGEKYNQELIPNTRVFGSDTTGAEAEKFDEEQAVKDAGTSLADAATIEERNQQVQAIEQMFKEQLLTARPDLYDNDTASTTAALMGAWYSSLATHLGVSPAEAFAKYSAEFTGEELQGDQLNQKIPVRRVEGYSMLRTQKDNAITGTYYYGDEAGATHEIDAGNSLIANSKADALLKLGFDRTKLLALMKEMHPDDNVEENLRLLESGKMRNRTYDRLDHELGRLAKAAGYDTIQLQNEPNTGGVSGSQKEVIDLRPRDESTARLTPKLNQSAAQPVPISVDQMVKAKVVKKITIEKVSRDGGYFVDSSGEFYTLNKASHESALRQANMLATDTPVGFSTLAASLKQSGLMRVRTQGSLIAIEMGNSPSRRQLNAIDDLAMFNGATDVALDLYKHGDLISKTVRASDAARVISQFYSKTYQQTNRGSIQFLTDKARISLSQNADLTTALHESAHLFLETYRQLAAQENAPEFFKGEAKILEEWLNGTKPLKEGYVRLYRGEQKTGKPLSGSLLPAWITESSGKWFTPNRKIAEGYGGKILSVDIPQDVATSSRVSKVGYGDEYVIPEQWVSQATEIGTDREGHEKFADAFEHYLFTGAAPNEGLRSVFRMFADWFKKVYKSLSNIGREFSPEVQGVVDRMISASDAIDVGQAQLRAEPMFTSKEQAGLTDEEWTDYQNMHTAATQQAVELLQRRSINDMKWLRGARSRELKRLQKQVEQRRIEAHQVAEDEVRNRKERQVERFLAKGEIVDANGNVQKYGVHKLDIGELETMYKSLEEDDAPVPDWRNLKSGNKSLISEAGLHPDDVASMSGFSSGDEMVRKLSTMPPIEDEIESLTDLIMLETYGDIYNKETLDRAVDDSIHNDARIRVAATELKALGAAVSVGKLVKAAKTFALRAIERKQVGQLRQRDFQLAEARSAKLAMKALTEGDLIAAAMHKRNQILNGIASKIAGATQDAIKNDVAYTKKFRKASLRDAIGGDTVDQIAGLLERFGFREPTQVTRVSLQEWIDEQAQTGLEPVVAPWIHSAEQTQYTALPVHEFNDLMEAIKSIEAVGRNRQKMLRSNQEITFAQAEENAVNSIQENATKTIPQGVTPATGVIQKLKDIEVQTHLFDFVMRELDGWKDDGVMHNLLVRTKNEAADFKTRRLFAAYKELNRLQRTLDSGPGMGTKTFIREIGMSLTRAERLVFALYTGTNESYQRLVDGGIYSGPAKLTPEQIRSVVDTLTKTEMDYVQAIWDYNDSFWPEIAEKEKKLKGFAPKRSEIRTVETKHGDYRGGYLSIRYDYRGSETSSDIDSPDDVYEKARMGRFVGQVTRHGFLQERARQVKDRPLSLNPNTIVRHVQGVVHDLAFHEWSIDAWRLLHSQKVASAIRTRYGDHVLNNLRTDVKTFVTGEIPAMSNVDRGLRFLMKGSAVATLAFNVNTALMQPLGLLQSVPRIGATGIATGLARVLTSTATLQRASTYIVERSPFMAERSQTFIRELNLFRDEYNTKGKIRKGLSRIQNAIVNDAGFAMIRGLQGVTDNIIWLGAESKGLRKGMDAKSAARYADQQVRDTQGSGLLTDRASIESTIGGQVLTMYWTFFSRTYNLSREVIGKQKSFKDLPRSAYHFGVMIGASSALSQVLFAMTRGKDPKDEMNPRDFGSDLASFMLNMVPYLKEISGAPKGFDYRGPAAFRFFAEAYKLTQISTDEEAKTEKGRESQNAEWWKAFMATTGMGLHLPTAQIDKSLRGTLSFMESRENPEQILFGPKLEKK